MHEIQPVAVLPPEVSRRIAAGEVIERPASVVRELLDNSLDAGARAIDVSWEAGGSELIRVSDDGRGMSRDDLLLCCRPHATSKIRSLEDLERSVSLGFRGEALASVSAVSDLEIRSTRTDAAQGWRLGMRHGEQTRFEPAAPRPGTVLEVRRLFANLPARRRFLSRAQAESSAIRATVLDKALPFPEVRFTHGSESGSPRVLPAQSQLERVAAVFGGKVPPPSLREVRGSGEGFSLEIIAAEPAIVRRDRRLIQIFVNGRRVWEYRLVQAVEYAYQDVQHGGLFPVAAVLLSIDPALVDFNIHPAKRELRMRNSGEVHHRLVEVLREFLRAWTVKATRLEGPELTEIWERPGPIRPSTAQPGHPGKHGPGRSADTGRPGLRHRGSTPQPAWRRPAHFDHETRAIPDENTLVYRGTLFGTYLLVERGERAWIIDQHAAHERLLYNRFAAARSSQALLVPEEFDTSDDQDALLRKHADEYTSLGIQLRRLAPRRWQLEAMPAAYREQAEDLIETILSLEGLQEGLDRTFLAEMACKAALKAGDYLDELTAVQLAGKVLALPEPRCPHGRPLFIELDAHQIARLIGRE